MAKFLKQAGTGQFYLHTDILAQRPDMFPVDAEDVPVQFGGTKEPVKAKPAKGKKDDADKGDSDKGE